MVVSGKKTRSKDTDDMDSGTGEKREEAPEAGGGMTVFFPLLGLLTGRRRARAGYLKLNGRPVTKVGIRYTIRRSKISCPKKQEKHGHVNGNT